jgi:hypothetical protein
MSGYLRRIIDRRLALYLAVAVLCSFACRRSPFRAVKMPSEAAPNSQLAELWRDPGDTRQDLFAGPGGTDAPSPDGRYEFVSRDTTGFSPGYDVRDESGRLWSVKLGVEARPEVVVSRILWASGYHQHPMYYLPRWTLTGGDTPGPQPAGRFRLKPAGHRNTGEWSFFENPFVGSRAYRGLLSILLVLNSYDLADSNNTLYELSAPEGGIARWYVVKDIGGALGGHKALLGSIRSATKDDLDRFEKTGFVKGYDGQRARLDYKGRYYHNLYDQHDVSDIQWVRDRLGRLTESQWNDAFRAGGYSPEETARFVSKIQNKLETAGQGAPTLVPAPAAAAAGN